MTPLFTHQEKIVHCSHHKAGSIWVFRVLEELCYAHKIPFAVLEGNRNLTAYQQATVLYDNNSNAIFDIENYRGSHMVRDLRDVIVSGYFYHLWTNESWVHCSVDTGMTYQQKLNLLPFEDGLSFEMMGKAMQTYQYMSEWNYFQPRFIEVKYEALITNGDEEFRKLFSHWGVSPEYMDECVEVSRKYHMTRQTGRKLGEVKEGTHMRSGKPGQWKEHFSEAHKCQFKRLFGDILVRLGYEKDNNW